MSLTPKVYKIYTPLLGADKLLENLANIFGHNFVMGKHPVLGCSNQHS